MVGNSGSRDSASGSGEGGAGGRPVGFPQSSQNARPAPRGFPQYPQNRAMAPTSNQRDQHPRLWITTGVIYTRGVLVLPEK